MNADQTPKAYSYIRWSSEKQRSGDSQRRQTEAARKWAAAHGLELDETTNYTDAGVSAFQGANAETGRLGEFKQAVDDGIVPRGSYLLVESLDRISRRKARHAVRALEDICDAGVNVVTLSDRRVYSSDTLDDDPTAFMYAVMVAMRAHEESATKSKRVRAARERNRQQAASGEKTTRKAPAWLTLSDDRQQFIVDEDKAATIRKIYGMYDKGHGQSAIARALNEEGTPSFGGRAWNKTYIGKLLRSKATIGTLEQYKHREPGSDGPRTEKVGEVADYYPAVVEADLAGRVHLRAKGVQPKGRHANRETKNLFAGVGRCPHCAGAMVRVSNSQRAGGDRLVCLRGRTGGCSGKSATLRHLVDAVREDVAYLMAVDEMGGTAEALAVQQAELDRDLAARRVRELSEQIAEDPSLVPTLRGPLTSAQERLSAAEDRLRWALDASEVAMGPAWRIEAERFEKAMTEEEVDVPSANQALRRLADHVEVDIEAKRLRFVWRNGAEKDILFGSPF